MVSYAFNIFHMRNHRGKIVYGIQWLDRLTFPLYEFIERVGMIAPEFWEMHHNGTHHMETNTLDDEDVSNPFDHGIRLTRECPHKPIHEYQHIYTHVLLSLVTSMYPIDNLFKHKGNPVFFVAFYCVLYVLPVYLHGWDIFAPILLSQMAMSLSVGYLFQVSHNHEELGGSSEHCLLFLLAYWRPVHRISYHLGLVFD